MRLSEWRASAPAKDAVGPRVAAVVDPVLLSLGADADPHCWVAWGEEPNNRYTIFAPTDPGLIASFVRVNVAGEGPRATTKLVRWNKVVIGELAVETQAGHRMLSFQLESQVLRGVDTEADRAAAFALRVIAAIDGRPLPPVAESGGRPKPSATTAANRGSAKPPATKPAATKPARPTSRSTKPAGTTTARTAIGPGAAGRAKAPSDAGR
jgi:hypothetical protein